VSVNIANGNNPESISASQNAAEMSREEASYLPPVTLSKRSLQEFNENTKASEMPGQLDMEQLSGISSLSDESD